MWLLFNTFIYEMGNCISAVSEGHVHVRKMDPEHRRKFNDPELLKCVNFETLAPSLRDIGILNADMIAEIQVHKEPHERNRRLLELVLRSGPQAWELFFDVLENNNTLRAVSPLTGRIREGIKGKLQVIPAKEWKRGDDVYPMERNPRGRCLIINNHNFTDQKARRTGSQVDVHNIKQLFTELHFECEVRSDLTAKGMKDWLSRKAQEEQQKAADCLVVVLMSHGDKDTIYGVDHKPLPLESIYAQFNNKNCPSLQRKPKLFFVQACRGGKSDKGTDKYVAPDMVGSGEIPGTSTSDCGALKRPKKLASWSDMYICYGTTPGYESYRNTATGTLYVSAVCKVFSQHAGSKHLQKLLSLVSAEVSSESTGDGSFQTPSNEDRGWRKDFYFNPGFFVCLGNKRRVHGHLQQIARPIVVHRPNVRSWP